jgi:hypothetical protein
LRLVAFSRFPAEGGSYVRAEVVDAKGTRVMKEWYRNDLGFSFAAVAWNRESSVVALTWSDLYHGTETGAYDVDKGTAVNPAGILPELADRIRTEYPLAKDMTDPIRWSATVDAQMAFARTHSR